VKNRVIKQDEVFYHVAAGLRNVRQVFRMRDQKLVTAKIAKEGREDR
jgi:hypothetical protein